MCNASGIGEISEAGGRFIVERDSFEPVTGIEFPLCEYRTGF